MKCHTYVQETHTHTHTRTIKLLTSNIKKIIYITLQRKDMLLRQYIFKQRKRHTIFKYKMSGLSFNFAVQNFSFTLLICCFMYIAK